MPTQSNTQLLLDQLAVRQLIDDWIIYRDYRQWDRVRETWHDGGVMMTTWGGRGTPEEFAVAAEKGFQHGDRMLHSNGGTAVDIVGDRAVAQTKLRIMQRGLVEGVLCDVICIGRDYDFCERRNGRWGFVLRQPIYERDSINPVDPSEVVKLDRKKLAALPDGYSRLGYLQRDLGYSISNRLPILDGPETEALYRAGKAWLSGGELTWGNA
jgi:hypothetical protein